MPTATAFLREALTLDARGREKQAISLYRQAIGKGLSGNNLHTALIGLGSSLRTTGHTKAAVTTLQKARRLFPSDPAIALFLALAHADADQERLALRQLADMLLKESTNSRLRPFRSVLARKYHALR